MRTYTLFFSILFQQIRHRRNGTDLKCLPQQSQLPAEKIQRIRDSRNNKEFLPGHFYYLFFPVLLLYDNPRLLEYAGSPIGNIFHHDSIGAHMYMISDCHIGQHLSPRSKFCSVANYHIASRYRYLMIDRAVHPYFDIVSYYNAIGTMRQIRRSGKVRLTMQICPERTMVTGIYAFIQ